MALLPEDERAAIWEMWEAREHAMRGGVQARAVLDL